VRWTIGIEDFGRVPYRVGRHCQELHPVFHRRSVDLALNVRDHLGMDWTQIGATREDEVEHHDLVREIRKADGLSVRVGQFERRRSRFVDDLKELLLTAHHLVEIGARMMRQRGRRGGQQQRNHCDQDSYFHNPCFPVEEGFGGARSNRAHRACSCSRRLISA
jgi:hypothetical protein